MSETKTSVLKTCAKRKHSQRGKIQGTDFEGGILASEANEERYRRQTLNKEG
jgi:hypothetical protein